MPADEPILTDEMLDERLAWLGTPGAGKTFAAKGFVERLLRLRRRTCVVDPLGVWWGLRSSPDGTAPAFDIPVFGGAHGDVPITRKQGDTVARIIATRDTSAVVDLSELDSDAARREFMLAFADTIYETNREPLHLVMDEADMFAPQSPTGAEAMLLHRMIEIARRGRVRGFIPWLITQRPAVLNKNVLGMIDTLIMMKIVSATDRGAVGGWIEGAADKERTKQLLAELATLQKGEGVIYAPSHGILQRTKFPPIASYDSSRTPRRGETVTSVVLPTIDISGIAAALAPPEDDATPPVGPARGDPTASAQAREEGYQAGWADAKRAAQEQEDALREAIDGALQRLAPFAETVDGKPTVTIRPEQVIVAEASPLSKETIGRIVAERTAQPSSLEVTPARRRKPAAPPLASAKQMGGMDRMLAVLSAYSPVILAEADWALLVGMKHTGGTWGTYKGRLLRESTVYRVDAGRYGITPAGKNLIGAQPKPELSKILWRIKSEIGGGPGKMLDEVAAYGEHGVSKTGLAALLEMAESGGTFGTYLGRLRRSGAVEVRPGGIYALQPILLEMIE